jgi:hypothetical protein
MPKLVDGQTYYSERIKGERRNYNWPVRFDLTDGLLGITQLGDETVRDRVLLSPKQVQEMLKFLKSEHG